MANDEAQAAKRIEQLREEIRKHDRLYYEKAAPIVSDREYDRLYKELIDLESQFPDLVTTDSPTRYVGESVVTRSGNCDSRSIKIGRAHV